MSTKISKLYKYAISNISIKGNLISWENHSVWISGITHLWIGRVPVKAFPTTPFLILLFIALSGHHIISIIAMTAALAIGSALWIYKRRRSNMVKQVNVRLHSGEILSFGADNEDSIIQFYNILKAAADKGNISETTFDEDGKIVEIPEETSNKKEAGIMEINVKNTVNEQLLSELQKLYQGYIKKTDANSEILQLINDAAKMIEANDREGLKAAFRKFVTLGLISDCNELSLDSLIQEIKSSIY